jgi:phage tail sheath protein FI
MSDTKHGQNGTSSRSFSPEVHLEEVSSGPRPIEGVGTAVAAFVGLARRQPVRTALVAAGIAMVLLAVVGARRR